MKEDLRPIRAKVKVLSCEILVLLRVLQILVLIVWTFQITRCGKDSIVCRTKNSDVYDNFSNEISSPFT